MKERELTPEEMQKLLKCDCWAPHRPAKCDKCGCTEGFGRRIFHVKGVPFAKRRENDTQDLVCLLFGVKYAIMTVYLRTCNRKFYVDSAVCPKCKSTDITYESDLQHSPAGPAKPAGKAGTHADQDAIRKKGGVN